MRHVSLEQGNEETRNSSNQTGVFNGNQKAKEHGDVYRMTYNPDHRDRETKSLNTRTKLGDEWDTAGNK